MQSKRETMSCDRCGGLLLSDGYSTDASRADVMQVPLSVTCPGPGSSAGGGIHGDCVSRRIG